MAPVDHESLLNIPLVAQLWDDPSVRIQVRGVDSRWYRANVVDRRVEGFNAFTGTIFTGRHTNLASWLGHAAESARAYNHDDRLVEEVLFAVHDYLHIWAYRWIARLWPDLGFGQADITSENFEDMVFCHLLSEAVATVGLDYWYLSCVDLNQVVPIGTAKRGLTVSYRENLIDEYRHFGSGFYAQRPEFFELIAQFYCTGVFPGFSALDMQHSPALRGWLMHELDYGKLQRQYCREWFAYLSNGRVNIAQAKLGRPVVPGGPERQTLLREVGVLLWAKVKQGDLADSGFRFDPDHLWSAARGGKQLFQFLNFNRVGMPKKAKLSGLSARSMSYLIHQYIVQLDFGKFPKDARPIFDLIYGRRDLALAESLLGEFARVEAGDDEPRDLFLYN